MNVQAEARKINFVGLLTNLLSALTPREKDVLERRHSLLREAKRKETLEKIGHDYNVTRERVRQIERDGIGKLHQQSGTAAVAQELMHIEEIVKKFLKKYGGVMQEDHLLDNLIDFYGISAGNLSSEEVSHHKRSLAFVISHLLAEKFERVDTLDEYHPTWKLKETPWQLVEDVIAQLVTLIDSHGRPVSIDELLTKLKSHSFYSNLNTRMGTAAAMQKDMMDLDEAILSYLRTSKKIKKNLYNQVGLAHWSTITPKRMADKIYLVMKEAGTPLHFTAIAEMINAAHFDHKKALPATIHNELILDDRYVLIGRGIYALKEWGYQPGTVAEVITTVLRAAGPLTKEQIIEAVGKQRVVKKATVNLALMNKDKFKKLPDKMYTIAG
ncbi:hypothetical protein HY933_02785 [Candidatus Falkowbacteria bacterium]|nr:hypothetical protein [Candidatus Falkowbacteria bacterium]